MTKADFLQAKGFIYSDIERELKLAKSGKDAGNFLAALGLLCYTEFAGKLKYGSGAASRNFNQFFDELGYRYKKFRSNHNVYDIFRCGLAHEYYVKKTCQIAMFGAGKRIGIGRARSKVYYLVVEKYFEDFKNAFEKLERYLYP